MSWGTSHLAVEQALETGERTAAVLGCGGVGLATARLLQRRGFAVTIYSKDLPPNTTSNISGAQWSPAESYDSDHLTPAFREQFTRAARLSRREYQLLVGDYYGVRWIENYSISDRPFGRPMGAGQGIEDLYPDVHDLDPRDRPFPGRFVPPSRHADRAVGACRPCCGTICCPEEAGGARPPDRAALRGAAGRLVVNCTGLGAKASSATRS